MDSLSWITLSRELAAWLADASLRAVALALLALLLIPFFRRNPIAQHTIWTLVLTGMLALPLLRLVVPATHIHLPQVRVPAAIQMEPVRRVTAPRPLTVPTSPAETPLPAQRHWRLLIMAVYFAGAALFGARLRVGVLSTRHTLRNTRQIPSDLWEYYELVAQANVDLSLEESDSVRVPLTTGWNPTRVIFPADWREWTTAKVQAVLAHELAHARRRDPLIALLAAVNQCVFWFHPLAWWLQRQLAVLAEHAADDAALAVSFDTQAYARLLLETAAALKNGGSRLIWHSPAMSGPRRRPIVVQRIRRVLGLQTAARLKPLGHIRRAMLLSAGAMLIWISTTVDVRTLAAGQGPVGNPFATTAEQAAALEQDLAANPENSAAREKLIMYYFINRMSERKVPLILWLIDHHPESQLNELARIFPQLDGRDAYGDARSHWLTQVNLYPTDARVLANAASALRFDGPEKHIDLQRRAREIDPAHQTEPLARIYSITLLWNNEAGTQPYLKDPGIAAEVRSELQSSDDLALVGSVARHFAEDAARESIEPRGNWDFNAVRTLATELITHAQTLDPQNREWSDLMEGVDGLHARPLAPKIGVVPGAAPSAIRIGGMVQAANLLESPPPIYPPLAKAARIEGTVKLQIHIGEDGRVIDASLISGHPLLVTAAINAAKGYLYKPTMLNNQPVAVLTNVDIVFRLAEP